MIDNNIIFIPIEVEEIPPEATATVRMFKKGIEIQTLGRAPPKFTTRKLSKTEYVDMLTGEIRQYNRSENRALSINSLQKSFRNLSDIIKANFVGGSEIMITVDYGVPMTNTDKLTNDIKLFIRKLRRKIPCLEYINIVEYKGNGDLHAHILMFRSDSKRLTFDRDWLVKKWNNQNLYVQRIKNFEAVEKLTTYFNPFWNKKKFDRLRFYDSDFKIYRCSRGIARPTATELTYAEAEELIEHLDLKLKHQERLSVQIENCEVQAITKQYFG